MIEILQSGPLVTIQDLGRTEFRAIGVGFSGAMDWLALSAGNLLVGNDPGAAGIELTGSPFKIRFGADTAIAITGADTIAEIDNVALPPWWAINVSRGSELSIKPTKLGLRAYVCFAGGLDVPVVLGSRSTDLKARLGGVAGAALQAGTTLRTIAAGIPTLPEGGFGAVPPSGGQTDAGTTGVDVIPAADEARLLPEGRSLFWDSEWTVTTDSNRMGLRLAGPKLPMRDGPDLLSHPILPGAIQLPPSGQPIIQACDANTCGGYPIVGVVIEAHQHRLGQVRLGGKIQFRRTDQRAALDSYRATMKYLDQLRNMASLIRAAGDR